MYVLHALAAAIGAVGRTAWVGRGERKGAAGVGFDGGLWLCVGRFDAFSWRRALGWRSGLRRGWGRSGRGLWGGFGDRRGG